MATIAIIGPGAVGGVIAGGLTQRGGHTLTLCARRATGELTVELSSGPVKLAATTLTDPKQGRPVDWVLVTTKAYDAAGAAAWFSSARQAKPRWNSSPSSWYACGF